MWRGADVPGMGDVPPDVRTVHLGAFTPEHAVAIGRELDELGIVWWTKQPGFLSRIWEFGEVQIFVDRAELDRARLIADRVAGPDH
jgi:hypothetical protein